ncbi:MAG TPA: hypothetical protein VHD84_03380, partial [Candidatus Saccharimonadales bacterium]|nr:hypothetical protein [Candidatus Saccharimonadales bacterium]
NQIPKDSRIVSNNTHMAMYTAYYDGFHSYGIIKPTGIANRDNDLYKELKRFGVSYYIDYLNVQAPKYTAQFLTNYTTYDKTVTAKNGHQVFTIAIYAFK